MHIDTNDPKNDHLEIKTLQMGKMILQIDKNERLHFRDVRGRDVTVAIERSDETLIKILDAALRGSGTPPPPPPPDTTRKEPASNLIDPRNMNATLHHREQQRVQYGRDPAALEYEQANPPADLGAGNLVLTGHRDF